MAEHRTELKDNGFTRRVMRRLPGRKPLWARLWTVTGYTLALLLLIAFDGIPQLWCILRETFEGWLFQNATQGIDLRSVGIATVVLIGLGCSRMFQHAE